MMTKRRRSNVNLKTKVHNGPSPHVVALQAAKRRAENKTPVGLRRIFASFPELEDLINQLGDLVEACDSTSGKLIDPDSSYVSGDSTGDGIVAFGNVATHRAGVATHRFRQHQDRFRKEIGYVAYRVGVAMGGGDGEIHHEKPRCQKANCPEYGRRQPLGTTECLGCGRAFG